MTYTSLGGSVNKVVRRYSSLFSLPSHATINILLGVSCSLGGTLIFLSSGFSSAGVLLGITFGLTFLFFTLMADFLISSSLMKGDPLFNLKRCTALSLSSCLIWLGVLFLGTLVNLFLRSPKGWVAFFFLGFFGATTIRLLVLSTVSSSAVGKIFFSAILQPLFCVVPLGFLGSVVGYPLGVQYFVFLLGSLAFAVLTVFFFTHFLDSVGKKVLGTPSLSLFKAFFANWTEGLTEPLESVFEKFATEQDVTVSLLTFRTKKKIKAIIVVPAVHPGPFNNLGSSLLPFLIQDSIEREFRCVVSVPHGLVGHDLDLSSQQQNQRVINGILGFVVPSRNYSAATPFIRMEKNKAKASCQIFGEVALLTLTASPQTMEDLPSELNSYLAKEAERHGVSTLIIDAHNSIEPLSQANAGVLPPSEPFLTNLKAASLASLKKAQAHARGSLKVGAAKVLPQEFTLKDGMGPGGISVIITKVGDRKAAYITLDGNNMVSGLREKILLALNEIGIVDGEVLTTDTHAVCGIVKTARGYYPLGEAMEQSKLIGYVREASITALENLEPVVVSWRTGIIPKVKVIGEKQIEELTRVAERTAKRAKRLAISLFPASSLLLLFFFLF